MRLARPSTVHPPARKRFHLATAAATAVLSLAVAAVPAQAASQPSVAAGTSSTSSTSTAASSLTGGLDRKALRESLEAFHDAGMYGAFSAVRDGGAQWRGAAGVADVDTGRPVRPDFEHRIGSITKTFTAVAVLQQADRGRIDLDAPVGRYLPDLIPGERGREVTVRMLLNHTSGIGDHILGAFPALATDDPGKALDEGRFKHWEPEELVRFGLAAQPVAERGTYAYSNTNYVIAGLLLEKVTGQDAEDYITRQVIRKAGLRHTYFPDSPRISGPHAKMYESMYGYIDPARDYSVYDMSWAGTAGAMVSTMQDLNDFYRQLLGGKLLGADELRAMKTTVPMYETPPGEEALARYGLGIYTQQMPDGDWYWGHDGAVFGAGTWAMSSEDGRRQVALGFNLMKYQRYDENNVPLPDPIGEALNDYAIGALTGVFPSASATPSAPQRRQQAAPDPLTVTPPLVTPEQLRH
ncbi:serine hydrolase domain-containing protein [Streptomyces poonensis]|uniref:Hydrolase n=1 Tax=Streptomyces poonensis TaxID=68255 RepID=A0A918PCB0_9ACTN|nr:serine hydrolase domain-containing protein [Streptomyces poonensis]GGY98651.1 hydrolase [Streptomyces poonensis]